MATWDKAQACRSINAMESEVDVVPLSDPKVERLLMTLESEPAQQHQQSEPSAPSSLPSLPFERQTAEEAHNEKQLVSLPRMPRFSQLVDYDTMLLVDTGP